MQTFNINFAVPSKWSELSDKQLRFVYQLIADGNDAAALQTLCLLQWGGAKVVGRQPSGAYLLKKGTLATPSLGCTQQSAEQAPALPSLARGFLFEVTPTTIAELLPHLAWLAGVPAAPVRLAKINRREAIAADFQGVPFETYIVCDNLYQGYLQTQDESLLDELANVLYPSDKAFTPKPAERISIFYWMASLKDFFSRRFSHFLQPVPSDNANLLGSSPNYALLLQEAMDAQIRALTKGDVTKEGEILQLDTWRALTELNAQAKEYKQLQATMKK